MKKTFVGNWKMKPVSAAEARKIAALSDVPGAIVAPPFVFVEAVGETLKRAKLAAQDVFWENPEKGGAYTGEISAAMLKKLGVKCAIVGHSERRALLGETDELVSRKLAALHAAGIVPILCVGERESERRMGTGFAKEFVEDQILKGLSGIAGLPPKEIVIAYEPVWAIGTGTSAGPEDAAEMARAIKGFVACTWPKLKIKVLYGGSVDAKNIGMFAAQKDIDGFLVGGASVDPKELAKMLAILK